MDNEEIKYDQRHDSQNFDKGFKCKLCAQFLPFALTENLQISDIEHYKNFIKTTRQNCTYLKLVVNSDETMLSSTILNPELHGILGGTVLHGWYTECANSFFSDQCYIIC